jgi:glycosyltransferase involved in cell wall biosynthesis
MRVLLDCRMCGWSGVGRYTTGLARALAARGDVQLVQACAAEDAPPAQPGGAVTVVRLRFGPLGPAGAAELARAALGAAPDVVHCAHFPTPFPKRGPLVVTLHDLTPLLVPGVMPSRARRLAYACWNRRAARVADRVLVPSLHTAADVERLLRHPRGHIVVTPEAADDFAAGPVEELVGPVKEMVSHPYVLALANAKAHKDLGTLLRAWVVVAQRFPDVRLLLVGEPSDAPTVEAGARVLFTGRRSDGELRALYAGARVFVFPSRYEGFGLPPLEAMAFGAPVVCAEAASLPEVVGDAAEFFRPGDPFALAEAVVRVLGDRALRLRLSSEGRERAARFSWARTAGMSVAAYAQAIEAWRRRRA